MDRTQAKKGSSTKDKGPALRLDGRFSSQCDWREYLPSLETHGARRDLLGGPPWSLNPENVLWRGGLAVIAIAGVVGVSHVLGDRVSEDNDILVYLGSLTVVSLYLGRIPALVATGFCLLLLSFGPFQSGLLASGEPLQTGLSLVLFLFVADQVARLANQVRHEAWAADQEARLLSLFNEFNREVSTLTERPEVEAHLLSFLSERLGFPSQTTGVSEEVRAKVSDFLEINLGSGRYFRVHLDPSNSRSLEFWTEVVNQLSQTSGRSFERIVQTETEHRASILEATQKVQSALISSMSHDLQTPLASISGIFEVLGAEGIVISEEERQKLMELGASQTERLLHLVKNVINLSKLDGGGLRLELKDVSLEEIARSAIERFNPRDRQRVTLQVDGSPPEIQGDGLLLTQVTFNLLDNALKFSSDESMVEVRLLGQRQSCRLEVVDLGCGIEVFEQNRIFERFFRGRTPTKVPGSGLGLSICKSIVELHGGRLSFQSRVHEGTTFSMVMPTRELAKSEASS